MSIDQRRNNFKKIRSLCKGKIKDINDLMIEIKIPNKFLKRLKLNAAEYVSKSFNNGLQLKKESDVVREVKKSYKYLKNITPNGLLVPKAENSAAFNKIVKVYIDIINYLNIGKLIKEFHFPPNIRIKEGRVVKGNLKRSYPTELLHSDTWTGANPSWIAFHVFLFGDIQNNHIQYSYPNENFNENWLKPINKNTLNNKISKKFKILDYVASKNSIVLADAVILHRSHRNKKAGIRISLDTGFDIKMGKLKSFKLIKSKEKRMKKIRSKEMVSRSKFFNFKKKSINFKGSLNDKVTSGGGFKHSSNVSLKSI